MQGLIFILLIAAVPLAYFFIRGRCAKCGAKFSMKATGNTELSWQGTEKEYGCSKCGYTEWREQLPEGGGGSG